MAGEILSCSAFTQYLVDQLPVYDQLILEDIRPTDSWIANVKQGVWEPNSGVEHTIDRFNHVYANTTKVWSATDDTSCIGTPCDPTENRIGWGATRKTYFLEQQSWATDLLCFDQMMHITKAREQFRQIIEKILRPATSDIYSNFLRKRGLDHADKKFIANANLDEFTFEWTAVGDEEIFFDCSIPPTSVFKLVPQMLQRQFNRLMNIGYAGMNPFKETAPYIELVTDIETCWELDKLGGATGVGGTPSVSGNWRFTEWSAANEYWRYGFSGQIGNFMVRTDYRQLRFQYVGTQGAHAENPNNIYRYQVLLPYRNVASSGAGGEPGLKSEYNPAYDEAHFAVTYIWHKMGIEALVADGAPINPQMPFAQRNFGGRWQFVMDNLGEDVNGCVIENKRRNKGQFIADFKLGIRPLYTEFINVFFHKREPLCVPEIDTCSDDPGYVVQNYNSANAGCPADD